MTFFPKLLYFFRTIPLEFTNLMLQIFEQIFSQFIWAYTQPRRAYTFLTLPRERGGWALPNLKLYYWATVLQYSTELLYAPQVENHLGSSSPYVALLGDNVRGCLWRQLELGYYKRVRFKTLLNAYKVFTNVRKLYGLAKLNFYTLTQDNANLPSIFQSTYLQHWYLAGLNNLGDLITSEGVTPFSIIKDRFNLSNNQLFQYTAISNYLANKTGGAAGFARVDSIDLLLETNVPRIGGIYSLLKNQRLDDIDKTDQKWQSKLNALTNTFLRALELAQIYLLSSKLKAKFYKTAFFLYITPSKVSKWGTGNGNGSFCPRCLEYSADSVHMFATVLN